jgi:Icc-related predicted phosphoesterase
MFAGDIHGNISHAEWLFEHGAQNNVDIIIACGDFGFWPHYVWGKKFLNTVERMAMKANIHLYWVDGNHENHDIIDEMVTTHGGGKPIEIGSEWIRYIPRGCVFTIGSKKIMGYGGAYSWDWKDRELGISYWRQELINDYKVDELPEQKVDILVTHEAPLGKEISYKDKIAISVHQRELVSEIQQKVNPALHVCGHHHTRETWMNGDTEVHVLGRDDMADESVLILDI